MEIKPFFPRQSGVKLQFCAQVSAVCGYVCVVCSLWPEITASSLIFVVEGGFGEQSFKAGF